MLKQNKPNTDKGQRQTLTITMFFFLYNKISIVERLSGYASRFILLLSKGELNKNKKKTNSPMLETENKIFCGFKVVKKINCFLFPP